MIDELIRGRLDVTKRTREILPALLGNALFSLDELHIPLQLPFNEELPIVISFYEYYRFLERLVSTVLDANIAPLVLVCVKMPSPIPLPRGVLDSRVALFHDIDVESRQLAALGKDHLCVDTNFKLYSWSGADNRFVITWVHPNGKRLDLAALEKIRSVIDTLPVIIESYYTETVLEH